VRRWLAPIFCATLRVFFRRVEVFGRERVPERGPVIYVLNHPNALIDPLFLVCRAPRKVSFLAKEPLFRIPVIGLFVRAFESLPVYRRQDEHDPRKNRETFERASALLARERAIAIFPEGTTHSDPRLRPLKTGAARLALGAAEVARRAGGTSREAPALHIVPAGLFYSEKGSFRSEALLYFGDPIEVRGAGLEPDGNPPRRAVRDLTARIAMALADVTLQAEQEEALALIARATRLFSADGEGSGGARGLAAEFELRRRFLAAYRTLQSRAPERVAAAQERLLRYEAELRRAGLDPRFATPPSFGRRALARLALRALAKVGLLFPAGVAGAILHYPAYRVAGAVATRVAESDDVLATVKVLSAMLFFPLSWSVVALALGIAWGAGVAPAALVLLPILGYAALLFVEAIDEAATVARALRLVWTRPAALARLREQGRVLREEILDLGRLAESP
jgi:1-acyl-sn-glycerol-3-phosphate acyltransferase